MNKKPRKTPYKPKLQTLEMVPITDPAVCAALDELRKMEKPVIPQILRDYSRARQKEWEEKQAAKKPKR